MADWHVCLLLGFHVSLILACEGAIVAHVKILHDPFDFVGASSRVGGRFEAVLNALFQLDYFSLVRVADSP